jgi:hypothetical protein
MNRFRLRFAFRKLFANIAVLRKLTLKFSLYPKFYFRSFTQPPSSIDGLPGSGIGHRNPRFLQRQRAAFL